MNILITGATGFIGSHLTKELCKQGYHCRCLVRNIEKAKEIFKDYEDIEFVVGDVSKPETLKNIANNIDVVFHLAALLGDYHNKEEEIWNVNVNGTIILLNNINNLRKMIYCSTPGVQGLGIKNATEELPYDPRTIYEKSKMKAEKSIIEICNRKLIKWIILRPDFVYGPDDYRRIPLYEKIKNRKMYIIGKGNTYLSPTYIDDVVNAFINSINNNANNNIFNISGDSITVSCFFDNIANALNTKIPKFRIPLFLSIFIATIAQFIFNNILKKESPITKSKIDFLTLNHSTDNRKLKKHLFIPKYSFDRGIKKTVEWCNKMELL